MKAKRYLYSSIAIVCLLGAYGFYHWTISLYSYGCYENGKFFYSKEDYAVFAETQKVVRLFVGGPYQLEECTVYDTNNWRCKDTFGNFVTVNDGEQVINYMEDFEISRVIRVPLHRVVYWLRFIFKNSMRKLADVFYSTNY